MFDGDPSVVELLLAPRIGIGRSGLVIAGIAMVGAATAGKVITPPRLGPVVTTTGRPPCA